MTTIWKPIWKHYAQDLLVLGGPGNGKRTFLIIVTSCILYADSM